MHNKIRDIVITWIYQHIIQVYGSNIYNGNWQGYVDIISKYIVEFAVNAVGLWRVYDDTRKSPEACVESESIIKLVNVVNVAHKLSICKRKAFVNACWETFTNILHLFNAIYIITVW